MLNFHSGLHQDLDSNDPPPHGPRYLRSRILPRLRISIVVSVLPHCIREKSAIVQRGWKVVRCTCRSPRIGTGNGSGSVSILISHLTFTRNYMSNVATVAGILDTIYKSETPYSISSAPCPQPSPVSSHSASRSWRVMALVKDLANTTDRPKRIRTMPLARTAVSPAGGGSCEFAQLVL